MRTVEGEPVPVDQWAALDGVAVIVTEEWEYPETETDPETEDDEDATYDDEAEAVKVYRQMWVVPDIEASGLSHRSRVGRNDADLDDGPEDHDTEADGAADDEDEEHSEGRVSGRHAHKERGGRTTERMGG